ncbi:multiheme c-type cytochrome [Hydrogenimonas urashimensis]|uniref:multiheme c-type cytochrome n=1 Tax=Hydrogenimonas urashimensis TaxID=2740515 RepID=UPI00191653EF|nr:multiheme c-type cytochrome [Hydrogenimonas urashimensis]
MIRPLFLALFLTCAAWANQTFVASKVCAKCHPLIYKEYSESMHRNASVANDPIHRKIWEKHPLKAKKRYNCAVCHTPSDTKVIEALEKGESAMPSGSLIQKEEPIGCAYCHRIRSVQTHAKQNRNIINPTPKYFYAAKEGKTIEKRVKFHETSSFFGLSRTTAGSPFHTIDYGNRLFSTGHICLGCHDHKQNSHGFTICSMNIRENDPKKHNCIACHMPQVPGSYSTIQKSKTHTYHGFAGPHHHLNLLKKAVTLKASAKRSHLNVTVVNHSIHKLFTHPLRLGQLRVTIRRDGKIIRPKPINFYTVLGKEGKPAMPWIADTVLKSKGIDASSTKTFDTGIRVKKGDEVKVTLGLYIVNPKAAKKLGITEKKVTGFKPLTSQTFRF